MFEAALLTIAQGASSNHHTLSPTPEPCMYSPLTLSNLQPWFRKCSFLPWAQLKTACFRMPPLCTWDLNGQKGRGQGRGSGSATTVKRARLGWWSQHITIQSLTDAQPLLCFCFVAQTLMSTPLRLAKPQLPHKCFYLPDTRVALHGKPAAVPLPPSLPLLASPPRTHNPHTHACVLTWSMTPL